MRNARSRRVPGWIVASCMAAGMFGAATGHAAPGQLDPTFGHGGVVTTNFGWGGNWTAGQSVLRQSDGKLVVGGLGQKGGDAFALVRFNADGSPDVSFGEDGRALTQFSNTVSGLWNGVYGLAQQGDGKLVALGR